MEAPKPRPPEGTWDTLFLEDTCYLKEFPDLVGVISKTWHEPDDEWNDEPDFVPGNIATENEMNSLLQTGQPPRHFAVFEPSTPSQRSRLVHESEVKVLDRALAFGDVVKRNLKSPMSGTVISISTEVSVQHSFQIPSEPTSVVTGIPEAELCLAHEWNDGDLVIYKGCWIGVVEDVVDEVAIRLENGSVVIPEDSAGLEIPILSQEEEVAVRRCISSLAHGDSADVTDPPGERRPSGRSRRTGTVPAPALLSPGFTVATSKANLRRGKWLYGAYNPNVHPTGVIVAVKTTKLGVRWLRQNSMVTGRFVPVERPSTWLELEEGLPKLKRFCKSTGGFVGLDGTPYTSGGEATGGGVLQVGDRVRFKDLPRAVTRYPGIKNISRSDAMGFDINTFGVVSTLTRVRVRWQDLTETVDNARDLTPYLNVDEQEVWPGEIVVLKLDHDDSPKPPGSCQGIVFPSANTQKRSKVGVVQNVNSRERVANVKWFRNPVVEFNCDCVMPGFKTGELGDETEDVSVYEVMDLEAFSVRRGDFVSISPEYNASSGSGVSVASGGGAGRSAYGQIHPLRLEDINWAGLEGTDTLNDNIPINTLDNSLLMNLSAALGASSDPQLQGVGRQLNQIPFSSAAQYPQRSSVPQNSSRPRTPYEEAYLTQPVDWLGEVVDMGTDGLVTVRLGALDVPRDIRVLVDRLFIVFNDDMDFDDISEEEMDDSDDDLSFEEESDSGSDWSAIASSRFAFGANPRAPIAEDICYEGGERLDNGEEEDWLTDDGMEVDSNSSVADMDISVASVSDGVQLTTVEHGMEMHRIDTGEGTEAAKDVTTQTCHQPAPCLPSSMPAPEAFSIPETSEQPARFAILDTPVPFDHRFIKGYATRTEPTFLRRMHKEHNILSTSLPDGIVVRGWESRLDLLRVLIIGPMNTPYELAPFFFDFYFPDTFPQSPPIVHFHSWTGGVGRINPNLYEDGKVCLSLLGTWHAEQKNEAWSAGGSTVLQVLVSLMGLVLVREPYYNEAGFGVFEGADEVSLASALYSEKAYILSRGFVKHALETPMSGFEDEIKWLYLPHQKGGLNLLEAVICSTKEVVKRSECEETIAGGKAEESARERVGNVTAGALILLKRNLQALERVMERVSLCL
ncbi:hypothetical protein HOY80DRAFT_897550 [Tuber brumale]|nr:hypothetical protein HOY80DRAFT_897550 [Tuber brumale]